MSELNFNDLPPEILIKIFRLLDAKNLKDATLTCKLWKNLIESESRWSLNLDLDNDNEFGRDPPQKMNFVLTTNRKFGIMKILPDFLSEDNEILQIFHRHGSNVVNLSLYDVCIDNLASFAELLSLTPNVKDVHVGRIYFRGVSELPLDHVWPDLKKLKKLTISETDYPLLKCFRNAKLTTMIIDEEELSELPKHRDAFPDFLSSQAMLTSLTVSNCSISPSVLVELGKLNSIPFRLTQLEISDFGGELSSQDDDSILRFIKSQADNLEELSMEGWIHSLVFECVFVRMIKLNILSVEMNRIPRDINFYDRLMKNFSVRTLKLIDNWHSRKDKFFGNFLEKLPNIRSLILPKRTDDSKIIFEMAQNLSQLESLSVATTDERFVGVKFPNLKTLHIEYLDVAINWDEFTKIHPRLTELTIEHMHNDEAALTSDDMDQITSNVDLQSIRLGRCFVPDDRFVEIIRTKCSNLKVLDLHKSCVYHTED